MKYTVIKRLHEGFITFEAGEIIEIAEERARQLRNHVREAEEKSIEKTKSRKLKKKVK